MNVLVLRRKADEEFGWIISTYSSGHRPQPLRPWKICLLEHCNVRAMTDDTTQEYVSLLYICFVALDDIDRVVRTLCTNSMTE
jgi:hypothetical protein